MIRSMANVDSSATPTPGDTDSGQNQIATPATQEASTEVRTRKKSDPAWGYCTLITEGGRKKIKCMFCNDVFAGGGIHRFKEHLAKWPGNVTACKKVDPEVEHTMYQNLVDWTEKKKKAQQDYEEGNARWDKHFDKNLHAAGFWFNPNNQYNPQLREKYKFATSGVLDVIERYAGKDVALRNILTKEMKTFRNAEGDFGRASAINDRSGMLADEWWETYGCSAPNLQKLALRVLSQTCSASGCERSWSYFEHVHSKKRNRLEHQRLNDIVYVHCNLRLRQRSKIRTRNYDPISLEQIGMGNEAWILEDSPPRLNSEELNAFRSELSALSIQCSDELVLDLNAIEADAMEDSDEIQDIQDQERPQRDEDLFDFDGMAFDVGGSSACYAAPRDEWDPVNFD